ncbi:AGAP004951-PA-like protein [Anopheles sinensis]|uniref:AGAP004951-PA-like protein n=1 Tax=Anopheles sinensis TaxID=74873 RepID=A0A084WE16_ANOSI|nr:AGAP004951-PA-like protein [Anopheles sinensis]
MAFSEHHLPESHFRYLRYCGVYPRPTVGSRLRVWYTCVLLCIFVPLHLAYIVHNSTSDLMETCEEIMLMQVCTTAMLKFNIFFSNREKMYALLEAFKNIHVRFGEVEELYRFVRCHDMHAKLRRIYIISTTVVASLYVLNAVTASVTLSLQSGTLRFVTPMNFPYNYQHPVVFGLSFIYNIETMIMTMCISVTVDTCFSELSNDLALHFDIVGKRFAKLDFSAPVSTTAERELIRLIGYHGELLELAGKMMQQFQQVIFFLLLMVSTILCVLGYEFVIVTSVSKRLQVVAMAAVFITQAVIYTYNGSLVTEKSAAVSEGIYACNWYEASPAIKKTIYFCLMRAQKPIVMKSGFIEATLPTLKKILSSSGSYITMLLSLESDV